MLNHWVILWTPSRFNTPPSPVSYLLQENGDRILQENTGAILIDTPVINIICQENLSTILQENGGQIYSG